MQIYTLFTCVTGLTVLVFLLLTCDLLHTVPAGQSEQESIRDAVRQLSAGVSYQLRSR